VPPMEPCRPACTQQHQAVAIAGFLPRRVSPDIDPMGHVAFYY
jgi:hypothetical protein